MKPVIVVLAMHGAPPNDLPRHELAEFLGLHMRLEHAPQAERAVLEGHYAELEMKVCTWPRTQKNDPFYYASQELGEALSEATGYDVIVGFNEFCTPSLDEALEQAVDRGAAQIIVVTPMMTQGGEHSEVDIPSAIQRAQERHPAASFRYAWPFLVSEVAQFLAANIARAVNEKGQGDR